MKRVALGNPEDSKKTTLYDTVFYNGITGIGRARGIETTGRRQKRRNILLVYTDQEDRYISQFKYGIRY